MIHIYVCYSVVFQKAKFCHLNLKRYLPPWSKAKPSPSSSSYKHQTPFLNNVQLPLDRDNIWIKAILHCKKSWRSSSTPASGDAGPIHTGVEKSFRHPWRKLYYKYQTFSTDFYKCRTSSTELDCLKNNITWAPKFSDLLSNTLPRRHALFLIHRHI